MQVFVTRHAVHTSRRSEPEACLILSSVIDILHIPVPKIPQGAPLLPAGQTEERPVHFITKQSPQDRRREGVATPSVQTAVTATIQQKSNNQSLIINNLLMDERLTRLAMLTMLKSQHKRAAPTDGHTRSRQDGGTRPTVSTQTHKHDKEAHKSDRDQHFGPIRIIFSG